MQQQLQNNNKKFKLAVCQVKIVPDKQENLKYIQNQVEEAANNGAKIAVFGETFNCIYTNSYIKDAMEDFSDLDNCPTLNLLMSLSKKHDIHIVGSIPEKSGDDLFNTCIFINNLGELQAKYRKLHLFDIDIPGRGTYKESDTFTKGDLGFQVVETELATFGLGICYDIRFPEMSQALCKKGAQVLIFPSNFSPATGPYHWNILLQGRALDNQVYLVGASTRRYVEDTSLYQAHGHSAIVDPHGKILVQTDEQEAIIYHDIDLSQVEEVRQGIPTSIQKRKDLYELNVFN